MWSLDWIREGAATVVDDGERVEIPIAFEDETLRLTLEGPDVVDATRE